MNDATDWKIPKWPFLAGDALLLALAYFIVCQSSHPISEWEIIACLAAAASGALIGIVPFILDYRAMGKLIEVNALGAVSEKIQNLEKFSAQIASVADQLANVREIAQSNADKTIAAAKQIADKMAGEVQQFSEFMQKINDSEKSTLRLEADKLRRAEMEWLQTLVRILDHVFALHTAAARTGDPKFIEPLTHFQNACRDSSRRVGLAPFGAEADEPFDAERHRLADGKEKPADGALIAETISAGYTFQGKLLRPALVRVRETPSQKDLPEELEVKS